MMYYLAVIAVLALVSNSVMAGRQRMLLESYEMGSSSSKCLDCKSYTTQSDRQENAFIQTTTTGKYKKKMVKADGTYEMGQW